MGDIEDLHIMQKKNKMICYIEIFYDIFVYKQLL